MVFRCATFSSASLSLSCSSASCEAASGCSSSPVHHGTSPLRGPFSQILQATLDNISEPFLQQRFL